MSKEENRIVPVEPTQEMVDRAQEFWPDIRDMWAAMLASAPAAPQAAGVGEREAIARIMDPKGWETRDRQYDAIKRSTMHDKDRPLAFANADYYTRDSLTKADAILALRAPSREPEGGAVRQVIIGFDVEEYVDGYEFRGDEGSYTPTENERALITDAIHGVLSELSLATREEAPAEAGGEREDVAEIIDPAAFDDGPVHPQHLSGRRKLALAKADAILALRAQPQARDDAQPVISAGRVLADALRQYGFPVSGGAKAALWDHGSAEALALNEACVAFLAALQAEQGAK